MNQFWWAREVTMCSSRSERQATRTPNASRGMKIVDPGDPADCILTPKPHPDTQYGRGMRSK